MLEVVIKRVLIMPLLLLAASFVIFSMVYLAPGSPEATLLGGKRVDAATVQQVREKYHLNDPFFVQYASWLGRAGTGDLGDSISQQDTVANALRPRITPTLQLTVLAALMIVIAGIGFGVVSALRPDGAVDVLSSIGVLVMAAVAPAIMSMLLISIFAVSLGWFPALGLGDGGSLDRLEHLFLPAVALATSAVALVGRTTRVAMIRSLRQESVETARSRGLSSRNVVLKHALRHALIPAVTISGLVVGYLLSGAVIVEYAFGLNGLGSLLISAVERKDFALVQAITLLMVLAFLLINLCVDLLYAVIDPRVRLHARAAR
jgi:peptide/nickel transport system permease protein